MSLVIVYFYILNLFTFYSPGEFQCNNSRCIYPTQICDLKDDCGDGSDEDTFCRDYDCLNNQYKCPPTSSDAANATAAVNSTASGC